MARSFVRNERIRLGGVLKSELTRLALAVKFYVPSDEEDLCAIEDEVRETVDTEELLHVVENGAHFHARYRGCKHKTVRCVCPELQEDVLVPLRADVRRLLRSIDELRDRIANAGKIIVPDAVELEEFEWAEAPAAPAAERAEPHKSEKPVAGEDLLAATGAYWTAIVRASEDKYDFIASFPAFDPHEGLALFKKGAEVAFEHEYSCSVAAADYDDKTDFAVPSAVADVADAILHIQADSHSLPLPKRARHGGFDFKKPIEDIAGTFAALVVNKDAVECAGNTLWDMVGSNKKMTTNQILLAIAAHTNAYNSKTKCKTAETVLEFLKR